ncbi:MAG: PAS domain-containing protein [Parvularculaceae bacterium]|nr:PAS domain-containing protein [Parvularculaceae bacterium]
MDEDLADLIRKPAARMRARDFAWSVGIAAGVAAILAVRLALPDAAGAASWLPGWALPLAAFLAFLAALYVRYRFSSGRDWATPVQRVIETQLAARESEIESLLLARGVAQALPEPLFILDDAGMVKIANPAAEEFLGGAELEGRHFAAALRAPAVFEAVETVERTKRPQTVEFTAAGAVERSCRAFIAPLTADREADARTLVFIRDLTTERRLEQMRADFIASASHELRTPLASLIGFIETLRGPARRDEEAQEKFLGIMQSQAERMQRLVADLMSLSRIELNEHVPPTKTIDIRETAKDVIDGLGPILERTEAIIDFECEDDAAPFEIHGERDEIFQAIQNLIDNAVKYGGDPALVKIRLGRGVAPSLSADGEIAHRVGDSAAQVAARRAADADGIIYLQVRDFGPGVDRADLPRLTERFYRVNVERSRKTGGTGLGLAIVKHIVNRHKGGLQIESRLAGGTSFTCYFRALRPRAGGAGAAPLPAAGAASQNAQ